MSRKIPFRYRALVFALVMSCNTSIIVSAVIIRMHTQNIEQFMKVWPSSFVMSWPIVFLAILIIAPLVNKLLDKFVERELITKTQLTL